MYITAPIIYNNKYITNSNNILFAENTPPNGIKIKRIIESVNKKK